MCTKNINKVYYSRKIYISNKSLIFQINPNQWRDSGWWTGTFHRSRCDHGLGDHPPTNVMEGSKENRECKSPQKGKSVYWRFTNSIMALFLWKSSGSQNPVLSVNIHMNLQRANFGFAPEALALAFALRSKALCICWMKKYKCYQWHLILE